MAPPEGKRVSQMVTRLWLAFAPLGTFSAGSAQQNSPPVAAPLPPYAERGVPGPGHKLLEPLVGTWQVEKMLYVAGGTPENPLTSREITSQREWLADGRFLRDETRGQIAGSPY